MPPPQPTLPQPPPPPPPPPLPSLPQISPSFPVWPPSAAPPVRRRASCFLTEEPRQGVPGSLHAGDQMLQGRGGGRRVATPRRAPSPRFRPRLEDSPHSAQEGHMRLYHRCRGCSLTRLYRPPPVLGPPPLPCWVLPSRAWFLPPLGHSCSLPPVLGPIPPSPASFLCSPLLVLVVVLSALAPPRLPPSRFTPGLLMPAPAAPLPSSFPPPFRLSYPSQSPGVVH